MGKGKRAAIASEHADAASHRHILACVLRWNIYKAGRQEVRTIEFYKKEVRTIEFNKPSSSHRSLGLISFLKVPVHLYQGYRLVHLGP